MMVLSRYGWMDEFDYFMRGRDVIWHTAAEAMEKWEWWKFDQFLDYCYGTPRPEFLDALSALHGWRQWTFQQKPAIERHEIFERRRIKPSVRKRIFDRDGWKCRRCGVSHPLEVDHILAVRKWGTSDDHNLQTLCRRCNQHKGRTEDRP